MNIAVYCSAADNLPSAWVDAARTTGTWIGHNGARLIYGGVDAGLMAVAAQAAREAGAEIVGVVPARRRAQASPLNTTQISVADLSERKSAMQTLGDAFVVLPGGYGTLDEFASVFAYLNFTSRRRPIILHNPDGIFDPIIAQLNTMQSRGLMKPGCMDIITVTHTIQSLEQALNTLRNA